MAEKAPAGMGTPRPGFAKLRVSLERHFSGAKIAQWFGPRTPESRCVFYTENMSSSRRKYVYYMGGFEGRYPVRFRVGTGMKIGNDGGRVGVVLG